MRETCPVPNTIREFLSASLRQDEDLALSIRKTPRNTVRVEEEPGGFYHLPLNTRGGLRWVYPLAVHRARGVELLVAPVLFAPLRQSIVNTGIQPQPGFIEALLPASRPTQPIDHAPALPCCRTRRTIGGSRLPAAGHQRPQRRWGPIRPPGVSARFPRERRI